MLSKIQIRHSEQCEKMQMNGEEEEDKVRTIKQFLSYAEREGVINSEVFVKLEKFANYYVDSI